MIHFAYTFLNISIGSVEGIDGKLYASDKDKFKAFTNFSPVFLQLRILVLQLIFMLIKVMIFLYPVLL